ncbi:alpha/beta fold hydrolase [Halopelagius fulvigenes]|uniref:Alpha/beta fold hydrolase n=1 Tax=Halopelagius fulvigenes TaxID=1198324 RepID=A0ABD5U0F2_9EURY
MSQPVAESKLEHVDVVGPPDAPPIVFVHGTVFNRTMWAPQREALSEEYRVIVPDLPGHGGRRDESFTLESGVETVRQAVEQFSDDPVHLVGLSLGGYVATEFAHRHPEQVADLIISGSSANPVGLLGRMSDAVGRVTLRVSESELAEKAVDRLAAQWVRSRDLPPDQKSEIVDAGFDLRPFGEAGREIAGTDFRSAFADYDGPKLVLNGQWDVLMRRGEKAHAAAGDASVAVVEGAGHACNLERDEKYMHIVRRFIELDR